MTPEWVEAKTESGQSFNLQVLSQAINQQVEMAFSNILDSVAVERRHLDNVLQLNQFNPGGRIPTEQQRPPVLSKNSEILPRSKESASKDQHRERIQKLALKGMSAKQIAEELKTPMGEVELILSFQFKESN
jgi:DNA-directed RNA polymerase specialized sigma24 family protein